MTEVSQRAKFDYVRYAQVWEDADVLNAGLQPSPGGRFLSVASAGDNVLAMLLLDPNVIDAIDLNPTQLFALELRIAAIKTLTHDQFLQLMGAKESAHRATLFATVAPHLSVEARNFWQTQSLANKFGYANVGKFENYFRLFRQRILPLIHSKKTINELLTPKSKKERQEFYQQRWNTWRWRGLFKIFFSRTVMGHLGRDPEFFKYVTGSVADKILDRTKHALTYLPPDENPYLQSILHGRQTTALPLAWREEHYDTIRARVDRIQSHCTSIEAFLAQQPLAYTGFNLSDIFEYMDEPAFEKCITLIIQFSAPGARLVYWNMLAPRSRPDSLSKQLKPLTNLSESLHLQDNAFFYSRLVIEEKIG